MPVGERKRVVPGEGARQAAARPAPGRARSGASDGPVRVLVVDDHASFRTAVRTLVEATCGFELVGEADDGGGAIATTEALRPDLVLMDVRMREVDGIAATRAIKALRPLTVVVLISTVHPDELTPAAHECAADDVVWKRDLTQASLTEIWRRHHGDAG